MQLLGRKKGESVPLRKDPFGRVIESKIIEIQSKYVRAFQDTVEKFPALFPTDSSLQPVQAPYEEMRDGMFRQLDEQQERLREVGELYQSRKVTFEAVAGFLGTS